MAQLIQLIGRDIQSIGWSSPFTGGVFEHHEFTLTGHRVTTTGGYFPGDQLDKASHSVGVVDDIVTSSQLEWVDHSGALGGEGAAGARRRTHSFAIELLLGNHHQSSLRGMESLIQEAPRNTHHTRGWGLGEFLVEAIRDVSITQHLPGSLH